VTRWTEPRRRSRESWKAAGAGRKRRRVSPELRLKDAKLYLEEGPPSKLICPELGVNKNALYTWVKRYR
jgi:transposase-like protein